MLWKDNRVNLLIGWPTDCLPGSLQAAVAFIKIHLREVIAAT